MSPGLVASEDYRASHCRVQRSPSRHQKGWQHSRCSISGKSSVRTHQEFLYSISSSLGDFPISLIPYSICNLCDYMDYSTYMESLKIFTYKRKMYIFSFGVWITSLRMISFCSSIHLPAVRQKKKCSNKAVWHKKPRKIPLSLLCAGHLLPNMRTALECDSHSVRINQRKLYFFLLQAGFNCR